ncbi:hypothetical protein FHW16_001088 [Phyllobacterium myrsinacearum]|uniref:Uncharacterized protein n=1 Tax=Phyllobacterium myrsinacearum TaxID=28101 RepID=A0A839EIT9_9HYPH|nr:hypothetical protein [Phyllobacterium myrsinacearum]
MAKKKTGKPIIHVTANLGLFYVAIEYEGAESQLIGPFRDLDDAEIEKINQKKLHKKK